MTPICVTTFSEVMASLVTKEVNQQPSERLSGRKLNDGTDLVVIKLAEYVERGTYSIEEFRHRRGAHSKMLGILGINPAAQTVACWARVKCGMENIYHDTHPAPEIERACDARLVPFAEVLRQANFICILLPLSRDAEQLIGGQVVSIETPFYLKFR